MAEDAAIHSRKSPTTEASVEFMISKIETPVPGRIGRYAAIYLTTLEGTARFLGPAVVYLHPASQAESFHRILQKGAAATVSVQ